MIALIIVHAINTAAIVCRFQIMQNRGSLFTFLFRQIKNLGSLPFTVINF